MKRMVVGLFMAFALLFSSSAVAARIEVPAVLGYHAAVRDEGGNSIADGDWDVAFRITDVEGTVLYEEQQTVSATGGQVSALVGNGLTADGAPTGGVPLEVLRPDGGRYLEVQFGGMGPLPAMEISSVPYADYAQIALGAASGSITYDALAQGAIDEIAKALTGGAGSEAIVLRDEITTIYSDTSSATYIGVATADIENSSSADLQNVLDDLDGAIEVVEDQCAAEATSRSQADSDEATARQAADDAINTELVALQAQTNAIAAPSRLSFLRSIWGTVYEDATFYCVNASASGLGMYKYEVSFDEPLSNANYAVVATPNHNTDLGSNSPATLMLYDKTAAGFKVAISPSTSSAFRSFDFIVIGE